MQGGGTTPRRPLPTPETAMLRHALPLLLAASALPAAAITVDFDDLTPGASPTDLGQGVRVSAVNANDPALNAPVVYDFDGSPELAFGGQQAPFLGGGNVDPSEDLGNGLAVLGPDPARILEFRRPAGNLRFDFDQPVNAFGFTVVDVEGPEEFATDTGHFVSLFSGGEEVLRVDFADFLTPGSPFYDPTVAFGNNSANRIEPIAASLAGVESFDAAVLALGGSAVVDGIRATAAAVPTPGAAAAGLMLLAGATARRRRV